MQLDKLVTTLGLDKCDEIPFLIKQANKLKVSRPAYLATLVALIILAFMFFGIARGFFIKLMTVVYPLIQTIQTLETKNYQQAKQWLSYWIVVSIFHLIDDYFYWFLYYLPYYHFLKVIFFVSLFHPSIQGAEKFYDIIIHKYYVQFQEYVYSGKQQYKKQVNY